jgi:hypothetical protein
LQTWSYPGIWSFCHSSDIDASQGGGEVVGQQLGLQASFFNDSVTDVYGKNEDVNLRREIGT